jgi:hypothetical protein
MADDTTDTDVVVDTAPAKAAPAKAAAPAKDTVVAGKDTPAKDTAPAGDDYDWRSAIAGEDKKLAKRLDRFDALSTFGKSYFELDAKLNSGKMLPLPGEDATDEDRAAFTKALGIPDDPKKYEIKAKPPEGMELNDYDKQRLDAITASLHKAGGFMAHPNVVNEAHRIFYAEREEAEAQMEAAATIAKEKTEAMLGKLWPGQEKKRNLMFAEQAIANFFGKEFKDVAGMQFADGSRLGDNLQFIQAMAKVGRLTMEDPVFLEAGRNGADAYKSLQQEKADLMALRHSKPQDYGSQRVQARLQEIYAALERHDGRAEAQ